jgi:acetyl esterase/lipase
MSYYMSLKKAGVPVQMHLYAQGGHPYDMRPKKIPVAACPPSWNRGWPRSGAPGGGTSSYARIAHITK